VSGRVEGVMGNREVPRMVVLAACVGPGPGGAWGQASLGKEGGSRGKHGFPRATEPKAMEAA
jgi:hypothetical protein